MINQRYVFIERKLYSLNEYHSILNIKSFPNDIYKIEGSSFQFIITGFIIVNDKPIIIFPKNYSKPETDETLKAEIILLLKVIMKYRTERIHIPEELKLLIGDDNHNSTKIVSALAIIEDYLSYGVIRKESIHINDCVAGFTDWNKTINKGTPIISHRQVLYPNPIKRRRVIDNNNIVTQIHKYIISMCINTWGWIFDIENMFEGVDCPCEDERMLRILNNELSKTFIEREIYLIKHLIQYINATTGTKNNYSFYTMATPYFSLVWESICSYIYSNDYIKLSKWVAQPRWEGPAVPKTISQKPDILFVENSIFFILDAKYYDYNKKMPGWHDIVKQLFYKVTIERKIKKNKVPNIKSYENILVFPETASIDFKYLGKVYVDKDDELGEVKAIAINSKRAMEAYVYGDDFEYRNELLRWVMDLRENKVNP